MLLSTLRNSFGISHDVGEIGSCGKGSGVRFISSLETETFRLGPLWCWMRGMPQMGSFLEKYPVQSGFWNRSPPGRLGKKATSLLRNGIARRCPRIVGFRPDVRRGRGLSSGHEKNLVGLSFVFTNQDSASQPHFRCCLSKICGQPIKDFQSLPH